MCGGSGLPIATVGGRTPAVCAAPAACCCRASGGQTPPALLSPPPCPGPSPPLSCPTARPTDAAPAVVMAAPLAASCTLLSHLWNAPSLSAIPLTCPTPSTATATSAAAAPAGDRRAGGGQRRGARPPAAQHAAFYGGLSRLQVPQLHQEGLVGWLRAGAAFFLLDCRLPLSSATGTELYLPACLLQAPSWPHGGMP